MSGGGGQEGKKAAARGHRHPKDERHTRFAQGPVSSLCFHPKHPVLLSSSTTSILNIHHIAPAAHPTPNPLLTSVQARRVPILRSEFLCPEGDRVVFAGRRRFFYSWDLSTGHVTKINRVLGHRREHRSMDRFRLSPCGRHMAIVTTDEKGGGMINILDVNTMQWIAQTRLDSRAGIADFAWWSTGRRHDDTGPGRPGGGVEFGDEDVPWASGKTRALSAGRS